MTSTLIQGRTFTVVKHELGYSIQGSDNKTYMIGDEDQYDYMKALANRWESMEEFEEIADE